MPNLTTFGLELEVATEGPALVRYLHDAGFIAYPTMHRWHCDCDHCYDIQNTGYYFKAQTDSSCAGEVITRILHHDPDHEWYRGDVFDILQAATVEVDAEPGLSAGMHVHVGMQHLPGQDYQPKMLWAYLLWERQLERLAAGRWDSIRPGNNRRVHDDLRVFLDDWVRSSGQSPRGDRTSQLARTDEFVVGVAEQEMLMRQHQCNDRHSHLNVRTGHGTWEFRIWNSTRSAWRMELFTRASVAMVDPDVTDSLIEHNPFNRPRGVDALELLARNFDNGGHERAAELVRRQLGYLTDSAAEAPSTLTHF